MRKVTSLLPQARTKKEQQLEFCQAMSDLREGRFTSPDNSEIFDLAALAIFKDLKEGMTEEEQDDDLVLEAWRRSDPPRPRPTLRSRGWPRARALCRRGS